MSSSRFARPLLVVAALAVGLVAGAAFLPARPPLVAVVDLEKVFNTIDLHAWREATMKALADEFDLKVKELEQSVKEIQGELESFQPGSQSAIELQGRVQSAIGEYKAYDQFARLKIESERAKAMRESYLDIKEAAKKFAQLHHLDMVLLDDSIPEIERGNASRTVQQISARRLLYANAEFDVSDALIEQMNADFKSGGGVAPPRATPDATPAAPTSAGAGSSGAAP